MFLRPFIVAQLESFNLPYKHSVIHYFKSGHGERLLFCFHGYSQSSQSFAFITQQIKTDFTLIAIDFPFHGQTSWKEGLEFKPEDLAAITRQICSAQSLVYRNVTLMGFSMGGRIALNLLQYSPEEITKLVLIAPDGVQVNVWYRLATQSSYGNKFFKKTMQRPQMMFGFLRAINKLGLVNQSIYKFISFYIHDQKVRNDLYDRWTTIRGFRPDIRTIKDIIREKNIQVRLLYGEYDRVIRHARAKKLTRDIESYCQLTIVPTGHLLLAEEYADTIVALLKN